MKGGEDGLGMLERAGKTTDAVCHAVEDTNWGRNAAAVKLLRSEVIDRDRGRGC